VGDGLPGALRNYRSCRPALVVWSLTGSLPEVPLSIEPVDPRRPMGTRPLFPDWFKRRVAARAFGGLFLVALAVAFSFGAIGVGIGVIALGAVAAALVTVARRRRWRGL
jgi:hypothetical protein